MLVVVNKTRIVVVLHEASTEAVRAVDEALGAQRRGLGVVH